MGFLRTQGVSVTLLAKLGLLINGVNTFNFGLVILMDFATDFFRGLNDDTVGLA